MKEEAVRVVERCGMLPPLGVGGKGVPGVNRRIQGVGASGELKVELAGRAREAEKEEEVVKEEGEMVRKTSLLAVWVGKAVAAAKVVAKDMREVE
ncbi:hypothetical protein CYMTET_30810, partial [Cymbomonas tetramitiformis]